MEPRVDVITLAVADLERALAFYRDGLGLESPGLVGTEHAGDDENAAGAVAMFRLGGGTTLALYPRRELAKDAGVSAEEPSATELSLGQLVASRDEVDATLARAERAGAVVTAPPHDRPWGIYSGYFQDPDGHLWEIIWSPRSAPA